ACDRAESRRRRYRNARAARVRSSPPRSASAFAAGPHGLTAWAVSAPGSAGAHGLRAGPGDGRPQRRVEDLDGGVDLVLAYRQGRRHAQAVGVLPRAHDVHRQPAAQALVGDGRAERICGLARVAVADQLETDEQTPAADVADLLVLVLQLAQLAHQAVAAFGRARDEALLLDYVEDCESGRRGQRVGYVRGHVEESLGDGRLLDRAWGDGGGKRDAAAERLRHRQEVRHDAVELEAEHGAEAPEAGLCLVHHEQHAALSAELERPQEVPGRRNDDAARR